MKLLNSRLLFVISIVIPVLLPSVMNAQDIIWNDVMESAPWSVRNSGATAVFDGKLWFLNGCNDCDPQDDIWSTEDGTSWTCELADVPYPMHAAMTCLAYDNKLWIIGGITGN